MITTKADYRELDWDTPLQTNWPVMPDTVLSKDIMPLRSNYTQLCGVDVAFLKEQ